MLHSSQHFSAIATETDNMERYETREEMESMISGDKLEKASRKTQIPSKF